MYVSLWLCPLLFLALSLSLSVCPLLRIVCVCAFRKLTLLVWRAAANMDAAILDLGCGNGHVCELLLALGFTKYMCLPHAPLYLYV
jgi:hypothetical protein